jgi:hypothetical protein
MEVVAKRGTVPCSVVQGKIDLSRYRDPLYIAAIECLC